MILYSQYKNNGDTVKVDRQSIINNLKLLANTYSISEESKQVIESIIDKLK